MIEVLKYESNYKLLWDDFVKRSKNGSFFHYRDYMEYHSDRFLDSSLLFFEDDGLVAVMPANIFQNVLVSHGGLTFGGIVSDQKMKVSLMLNLFEQLIAHLKTQGIAMMIYKAIPHIYHKIPAEEDLCALFRVNARLIGRDFSSTIFLENRLRFSKGKRWSIRKARRNGLTVRESNHFRAFMLLMKEVLQSRYNIAPTHTGDELSLLASRFPNNIKLFAVHEGEDMLAGVVTFEHQNLVHTQYIGATDQGKKVGAPELILDYLVNEYGSKKKYFDFGKSTEKGGWYLNTGLVAYKEGFGARSVAYDTYEIDVSNGLAKLPALGSSRDIIKNPRH
jgi:hypothetical protein